MKINKFKLVRFSFIWMIINSQICDSIGMEKNEEDNSSIKAAGSLTYSESQEFPRTPFYCFTSKAPCTSHKLLINRSNLLRRTLVEVHRFSISDQEASLNFPKELYQSIVQSLVVCQKHDHPIAGLFSAQKKVFDDFYPSKKRSALDIRETIKDRIKVFFDRSKDKNDIDVIDFYLLNQHIVGEFTKKEVFRKTQKLVNAKREEIAVFYLMKFAFSVSLGSDPSSYYKRAVKLGCHEASNKLSQLKVEELVLARLMNMRPLLNPQGVGVLADFDGEALQEGNPIIPIHYSAGLIETTSES